MCVLSEKKFFNFSTIFFATCSFIELSKLCYQMRKTYTFSEFWKTYFIIQKNKGCIF